MSFEYIPGNTFFHKLDPRSKLLYFFTVMFIILNFTDLITLLIVFVIIIALNKLSGVPLRNVTSFLRKLTAVSLFYILFNILFLPYGAKPGPTVHVIGYLYNGLVPLSIEGIVWALAMLLRFLIILIVVKHILMVTSVKELLIGLVKWKLPPEFGVALSIGFAYIPVLEREVANIKEAQEARGLKHDYRDPIRRAKAMIPILIPSLLASFRRSTYIALAIESRGFSYDIRKRTYVQEVFFKPRDYIFIVALVCVAVFAAIIGIWGLNYANYYFTVNLIVREYPRILYLWNTIRNWIENLLGLF